MRNGVDLIDPASRGQSLVQCSPQTRNVLSPNAQYSATSLYIPSHLSFRLVPGLALNPQEQYVPCVSTPLPFSLSHANPSSGQAAIGVSLPLAIAV
jgi:hypothetical protein